MNIEIKTLKSFALFVFALGVANMANAFTPANSPLYLGASVPPMVMLDMSKDQQLYKKAYNDYADLDGDGQVETTYKHGIDYYGYFDSYKCYTYNSSNKRFQPSVVTTDKYCTPGSGMWSGNFLNWASMTRMDAVRKILYGGLRSPNRSNGDGSGISDGDTATTTVLERAFLPNDAHSWAKFYAGSDLAQLTPYVPPITTAASTTTQTITNNGSNTVSYAFTMASTTAFALNDYVQAATSGSAYLKGQVTAISATAITISVAKANYIGSGTFSVWTLTNLSKSGITICNTTDGDYSGTAPQGQSQSNTNLPRIRVAKGDFSLWSANERWQCRWNPSNNASNSNNFAESGVAAGSNNPNLTNQGTGAGLGDYFARVQACVPGLIGQEKCKLYPSGDYKPRGLLQFYGDNDQIKFGLLTGSYQKNISGGVLRKNIGSLTNEVNTTTDGTFIANPTGGGIIDTINKMRISGYYYGDGTYTGSYPNGDGCGFQLTSITQGNCTSWGNPMSEAYYESLRYFAGKSATPAYVYGSGSHDADLGLPLATWADPLNNTNYCSPLNVLVINASVSTDDDDLAGTGMSDINSSSTAAGLTNLVGTGEGINGGTYFVGRSGSSNNELCDGKLVAGLGNIAGICPEGPTLHGSYLMAGLAYQAHTNPIRTNLTVPTSDSKSLKVTTYGVQLATNVPRINITLTGETTPRVVLQPAYRLNVGSSVGGGSLVDLKIINGTSTASMASGKIYLNWEDSEQGGDYDQDMWGVVSYCLTIVQDGCGVGSQANTISITTNSIAASTANGQGFGYIITGTNRDGPHFHSGILGFNYADPTGVLGCANCQVSDAATTVTYNLGTSTVGTLQDPLFYAAKWGGFKDSDGNNTPNLVSEWDAKKTDPSDPSLQIDGTDGIPDNYFLVSNPLGLEASLNKAFLAILATSSASSVATNSSQLKTGSKVYQARFETKDWSGQLLSYSISLAGVVSATPDWDAGQVINSQVSASADSRNIITYGAAGGVPFHYANLTAAQQAALSLDSSDTVDTRGAERVNYLRGWSASEGTSSITFRSRPISKLGDIVNSNPWLVGEPSAGYSDIDNNGYSAFRTANLSRTTAIYAGANDGMMHAFAACVTTPTNTCPAGVVPGQELLGYVPSDAYFNLRKLTQQSYNTNHKYFADGSPMVGDVDFGVAPPAPYTAGWHSVLVAGLNAGGKGYYALDITDPANFSESSAASLVLWQFTNADDVDLGYTYNTPVVNRINNESRQIVKMQNGRWAVIVGNGYGSTANHAVLYILYVDGGLDKTWTPTTDFVKIDTGVGSGVAPNGLSTPYAFDSDGDGKVDTLYAGDLQGNLWKFDVSSASPASWVVANSGSPLFVAQDASSNRQPITTAPEVTIHPNGGKLVMFGTGKYLESGDAATTTTQSYYGIWDNGATVTRSQLVAQTVTRTISLTVTTSGDGTTKTTSTTQSCTGLGCVAADTYSSTTTMASSVVSPTQTTSNTYRSLSNNAVNYSGSNRGWYLDMPTTGERNVSNPKLETGLLYVNTLIPSSAACDFGGTGWLLGLDYLTGGQPSPQIFDSNGDGNIDSSDLPVAGLQIGAAIGGTTIIDGVNGSGSIGAGVSSKTDGTTNSTLIRQGDLRHGRIGWHELIQ
ncbi:MAG: PilC/PilY family type IV pilus protein [Pseudomonadota bacterium]